MSDEIPGNSNEIEHGIDVELSERELLSIGRIVALWGALEYEIFCQTLMCFADQPGSELPKEMNNMQFSQVLALWETRVVQTAAGDRKEVLQAQCESIRHFHGFRDALVHGMWDWSKTAPEKITATRIRKKEIIRTHFTADDLASFASALETINFKVRYPGGIEEFAKSMAEKGAHMSRRGVCLMTHNPLIEELFLSLLPKGGDKT